MGKCVHSKAVAATGHWGNLCGQTLGSSGWGSTVYQGTHLGQGLAVTVTSPAKQGRVAILSECTVPPPTETRAASCLPSAQCQNLLQLPARHQRGFLGLALT